MSHLPPSFAVRTSSLQIRNRTNIKDNAPFKKMNSPIILFEIVETIKYQ